MNIKRPLQNTKEREKNKSVFSDAPWHYATVLKSGVILCLLIFILATTSCIYRAQRQQGNIIEKEQVDKIQIGSSKNQVESYLGSPLLQHPLNPKQWIYVYQLRLNDGTFFRKHLIVHFDRQEKVFKLEKHNLNANPAK